MISQRLRGIGEDGEAIDGLAPKLQEAFKEYAGIDIQDQNGELRSTYDILSELAAVYPSLTSKERQYLGELAAGNRQVKVLNSIVSNWKDVEQAVSAATDSTGSAAEENAAFMDSIQGRLNELTSTFQEFSAGVVNDEFIKNTINAGIAVLDLVDRFGLLEDALIIVSGVLLAKYGSKALSGVVGFFGAVSKSVSDLISNFKAGKGEMGFFDRLASAAGTSKANLAIGAVTTGLTVLTTVYSAVKKAEEERRQAAIEAGDEAKSQSDKIFELSTQYMALSEAVKIDASAKSELLEVQKELIENLGAEKAGIDGVTQSLQEQTLAQLKANQASLLAAADAKKQNALDAANAWQPPWTRWNVFRDDETQAESIFKNKGIDISFDSFRGEWNLPGDTNSIEGLTQRINGLKEALIAMSEELGSTQAMENSVFDYLSDELNRIQPSVEEYQSAIGAVYESAAQIEVMSSLAGKALPETQSQFDNLRQSIIESVKDSEQFVDSEEDIASAEEDIASAVDNVLSTIPGFSEYMGEADSAMEELATTSEETEQTLEDMAGTVNSLKEVLANFAENGTFSSEDLSSLIELDPNLEDDVYAYIAGLRSADDLVEAIKASSKEAESLFRENVLNKLWPDIAEQKQIVSTMAQLYSLDAKNYKTIEEAKAAIKAQIENQKWLTTAASASDYVNFYLADFQNYAEFEKAKTQITAGVLTQIQGLNAVQIGQIAAQYGVDLSNFTDIEKQKPEVAAAIATKLIQTYGVVSAAQRKSLEESIASLEAQRKELLGDFRPGLIGPQKPVDFIKVREIESQISSLKQILSTTGSYDSNSFLAQLDNVLNDINVTIPEINNLLKDTEDAAKDAGDAAVEAAQKAVDELQELNDELQNSLDELNDDRANIESLLDTVMSMLKQRYDDEINRLDELIAKQEEQRDSEIEAIEAETKAYTDKIDAQLESLRAKDEEYKFNKELEKKNKELADLQAQLLALQLDDSDYGKKKRLELEEEIAEKTEELNDFQHDHALDLQEDALQKEKENAEDALDAKREALEEEYQAVIDNYEKQKDALEAYLDDEWNLRQEAYRLINKGGKELYDSLIEYNRHYGNAVDADVKQQWDKAYTSLKKYNDGQINVRSTLEKISSSAATLQGKIDALAPKIENARKKADSLKSSLDKSASSLSNANSKAQNLYDSLNKAANAAGRVAIPDRVQQYGIIDTETGEFVATGYKTLREAQAALRKSGAYSIRYNIKAYANGRIGGKDEWALVDEKGSEIITRQKGRMTYLENGDGVIPHDITKTLMSLGTNPVKYMSTVLSGILRTATTQGNVTNAPVSVEYGDIILQGNVDPMTEQRFKELLRQHKKEIAQVVYDATRKSAMKQGYAL